MTSSNPLRDEVDWYTEIAIAAPGRDASVRLSRCSFIVNVCRSATHGSWLTRLTPVASGLGALVVVVVSCAGAAVALVSTRAAAADDGADARPGVVAAPHSSRPRTLRPTGSCSNPEPR